MPYVRRNFIGKIIGVYTNPQPQPDGSCLTEPDPLPDDHPEVIAFLKDFPVLTQAYMTEEDFLREKNDQERVEREIPQLQDLVLRHIQA